MSVKKSNFYAVFYAFIIFIISFYLFPLFVNGDQGAYNKFYNNCFDYMYFLEEYSCYNSTLGTQEPIYFFLTKFFHVLVSKDILMSFINAIITFLFVKLIYRYLKSGFIHLFFILFFLNYYVFVLLFSAERLKLSVLFLLLSLLFAKVSILLNFFKVLTVLTHAQMIFIYCIELVYKLFNKEGRIWTRLLVMIGGLMIIGVVYYYMKGHIDRKILGYSSIINREIGFIALLKSFIFTFLTYISVGKNIVFLVHIPLMFGAYILGSGRILIMSFFIYLACLIYYKGKIDSWGYLVLFYFAIKSVDFWQNVIMYGTGFSEV